MHSRSPSWLFLFLFLLTGTSQAQDRPASHVGRVQDWTSRHLVVGGGLAAIDLAVAAKEPRVLFHLAERNLVTVSAGRIHPRRRDPENPAPEPDLSHRFIDGTDITQMNRRELKIDWSLNLGAGVVAPYMFPAKFSFDINAAPNCTNDYVVFGLNVAGVTGGQANIVAVNNLYSGSNPGGLCGANPSIRWSYTGSTASGRVLTSPAISLDGTKVAYIESTASAAIFHVLTLRPGGQGTSVTNAQAPTPNGSCTAATSCLKSVIYSPTATNTLASPWVDYQTDKAFVASDNGRIYRISCVFRCALNANPTVDWSFTLPVAGTGGAAAQPNSPVYNYPYGLLIVGDQLGELWVLKANGPVPSLFAGPVMIGGGGCTVTNPPGRTGTPAPCTANGGAFGIPDSVILDASGASQRIFAFTGNDGTAGASAVVAQLKQDLTGLVKVRVGRGSVGITPGVDLHTGAFDNKYFTTSPNIGKLFMCGTGPGNTTPTHYWIAFSAYPTIDSTPTGTLQRYNVTGLPCAPYTEIFNPNLNLAGQADHHDLLISGLVGAGTNGWIITNDISLGNIPAGLNTVNYPAGVSGIIIDNVSTAAQASSVYFTTEGIVNVGTCGNTRCAVKLRQLNLQ